MAAGLRLWQVDAFAGKPFSGNPAAVVLLPRSRPASWMRAVAAEMNLSETAFLLRRGDGFSLRWFTPAVEVPLCGHATLASAHVLFEEGCLRSASVAKFYTRSGPLTARRVSGWLELDFPALPQEPAKGPAGLERALGAKPVYVAKTPGNCLVEVRSEAVLRALEPDFKALAALPPSSFIVTAPSDSKRFDFVSRCFAPAEGIDEDPVTGSAHCCLGPFWGKRLGKSRLVAYQASCRGGVVRMELKGPRVLLRGKAVTVLRGALV